MSDTTASGPGPAPGRRPAVTVGLMTHNYGRFVGRAIDSVLAQTCPDWEMVVCDDASTDDTAEVVRPYLADPRVRYVRHERNLGQAGNWAFALGQGSAPVVAVLHGDDQWLPGAVAAAAAAFAAEPELDLFFGTYWRDEGDGSPRRLVATAAPVASTGRRYLRTQVLRNPVLPSAAFLSRWVVTAAGPPKGSYRMVVDFEFFSRVAAAARRVRSTGDPACVYHVHPASVSVRSDSDGTTAAEVERMAAELPARLRTAGASAHVIRTLEHSLARSMFEQGVADMVNGRADRGAVRMREAISLRWTILCRPKHLLDQMLTLCGGAGRKWMRRLHSGRVELPTGD